MSLRALTVTQPWATAVAKGVKRMETRRWSTGYRGWFAVHAAKGWELEDREFALEDAFRFLGLYPEEYPRGCIVAVAKLEKVVPAEKVEASDVERLFGWFEAGRFAWLLGEVRELPKPVACRGAQGWWTVPAAVEAEMRRQLGIGVVS